MLRQEKAMPQGGAAIVNVASISAKGGGFCCSAYAASKAGVVALTKSAAQELANHGIRCNAVLPGWTDTPMTAQIIERHRNIAVSLTPIKRAAQPEEIARDHQISVLTHCQFIRDGRRSRSHRRIQHVNL
ncbi:hypothetical protein MTO96_008410 [Rhipicephalus appendiculatus]